MSIVNAWLPEARVLDLFAGSGALGIEALSRGAAHVDFVENALTSVRLIGENLDMLGVGETARIHRVEARKFVAGLDAHAYDVAFADPPYDKGLATEVANAWLATPFADILGIEHRRSEKLPEGGEVRRYGETTITIYRDSR